MCRTLITLVLIVATVSASQAQDISAPNLPLNPDRHVRMALAHLKNTWPVRERAYIRYLSLWHAPEDRLSDWRRLLSFWCHQMTFEGAVRIPQEVSGSEGRLLWVDLRWYGWQSAAWEAVARRDLRVREPWVLHGPADALRCETGHRPPKIGKDGTVPVLGMVDAAWFLRETLETRRSVSYYDLLFSKQRFGESTFWPGGVDRGRDYPRGWYHEGTTPPGFVDKNFPADNAQWEKAFGVDVQKNFAKGARIDIDVGAVVMGGRDHPKDGSVVTLNNRLVVVYPGPFGPAMRSFDVFETTGNKDFSEVTIFKGGKFRKGTGAVAEADAGELLAYLPNGGQAGLLINAQEKRVETAGADAANDTVDKVLNQGVRTNGSCVTCHGATGGFISPRNRVEMERKAGIVRKFRDPQQAQRFEQFMFEWEESMAGAQKKYERLLTRTTDAPWDVKAVSWKGPDLAQQVLKFRSEYDAPVAVVRAGREMGLHLPAFKYLLSRSPKQRPLDLLQGLEVPSRTWEVDVYREVGLLLSAYREDSDYMRLTR